MPRRNLLLLALTALLSFVCYQRVPGNRYSLALAEVSDYVSRRYYVPVDDLKLFEASVGGMMIGLDKNDENSRYFTAGKRKKEFDEDLNKQFVGIGAIPSLEPKTEQLLLSPLPNSPALEAGIRAGDKVLKVDGRSTQGWSTKDAVERLRGEPDTPVTLTVLHAGASEPVEITIVRKVIHEETVQGYSRRDDKSRSWNFMLPGRDHIGYVRLTGFTEGDFHPAPGEKPKTTAGDLKAALAELARQGMRGLVLDLRNNRGGALDSAVDVCNLFLPSGLIVTTRGRDARILRSFQAKGNAPYAGVPMAILVNQESASASEIVAASMQDNGRAVVVGQRTYGKGTVQEVMDLGDPLGKLKLTVATFWRPSGRNIHRTKDNAKGPDWGVTPDKGCEVLVDDDELERFLRWQQYRELAEIAGAKGLSGGEVKEVPDRPLARAVECLERGAGK